LKTVLIAGCGFVGEAAALQFIKKGYRVVAITRSLDRADLLEQSGLHPRVVDISDPTSVQDLAIGLEETPEIVVHSASSGRGGEESYLNVYLRGMENLARSFPSSRFIFTSSTSVYAQTDGNWVQEDSPTIPDRSTGKILLAAEQSCLNAGGVVLRLAGIYGPGRSIYLKKFLEGTAILEGGGLRWINQIHRDDAAGAIVTLSEEIHSAGIYNVVDNMPCQQRELYGWLAEATNKPLPPAGPIDYNRKRGWTSKRVSNKKLRRTGWVATFPDYRSALPSLLPK
jgi:nucleoside-diphosphate-sugar epimerase